MDASDAVIDERANAGEAQATDGSAEATGPNERAESDNLNATQAQQKEGVEQESASSEIVAATKERQERFKALQARAVSRLWFTVLGRLSVSPGHCDYVLLTFSSRKHPHRRT